MASTLGVTGAVAVTGNVTLLGAETVSGLVTQNGGETVVGTTSINATGAAATNLGTGTGTVSVGNTSIQPRLWARLPWDHPGRHRCCHSEQHRDRDRPRNSQRRRNRRRHNQHQWHGRLRNHHRQCH